MEREKAKWRPLKNVQGGTTGTGRRIVERKLTTRNTCIYIHNIYSTLTHHATNTMLYRTNTAIHKNSNFLANHNHKFVLLKSFRFRCTLPFVLSFYTTTSIDTAGKARFVFTLHGFTFSQTQTYFHLHFYSVDEFLISFLFMIVLSCRKFYAKPNYANEDEKNDTS